MGMFEGALTALVTPFRDDRVDEAALRAVVSDQIAGGIDGIVPCGTTGESVNLSDAEYRRVLEIVVSETRGRVPVIAGAGSASTKHAIELAEIGRQVKVDGLLVVVPYYNRPTQEGMFAHFSAIARSVPLPTVLYNIPGRSGVDMQLSTLLRLAENPAVVAVKEATGNVLRSSEIASALGDRLTILSGDDALTLPIMAVGGKGVISVASNVAPAEVKKLVELWNAGNVAGARAQHHRLRELFEAMFLETSPGPVKAAMAMRGLMTDEIRLPLVLPSEATLARVRKAVAGLGLS
jgi:4-hydroxy-tetrahydrodipicolinate synthase